VQLAAGDRLGPYEVVAQIGAGGMGVVYRARDTRVGRDVAIKVSSRQFSDRFEREARAVAALNHPNICTLHDVGPDYLVMELVDGEPLTGPVPFETALDYARQIAAALDAAHEQGIVHRDLKPANIKVRSDGTIKVLDFGLAKMGAVANEIVQDPANSPTMAVDRTQAGIILGTAAYMSPEQARGRPVDKRADIWAFGVVFYELLTGRRAFGGEDVSTIVSAVIQSEPSWDGVPVTMRPLLESCLQKDPRKRLRDIGDVWKLLDTGPQSVAPSSRAGMAGWIAAAGLAIVVAMALWAPWRSAPSDAPRSLVRLDVDLGADVSLMPLIPPTYSSLIISPDGTRLVFVGSLSGATPRLFTRRLAAATIKELHGTEGAAAPFLSPDGQWVAFWNAGKLAKVPVEGGALVPLVDDLKAMTGGTWADDGSLVVGTGVPGTTGLLRVPADGGATSSILELAKGELFHAAPQVLPGGKAILMATISVPASLESTNVEVVTLDGRRRKTLLRGAISPRYLASGHLLYSNRSGMFALPFDVDSLEARGTAVAIWPDAAFDRVTGSAQFDVSRGGTLVYRSASATAASQTMNVHWIDRLGKTEPLLTDAAEYVGAPRLSPDGRRLAMAIRDGANHDIWVYDTESGGRTKLTHGGGTFHQPVWSRSGRHVIFGSFGFGMMWARSDGSGQPQTLISTTSLMTPAAVSPRGEYRLAYQQFDGNPQLWSVGLEESDGALKAGTPIRFLTSRFIDSDGAVSPDGRWLAYHSTESGRLEVYVRPFPASPGGEKVTISTEGGGRPAWMPSGGELLYQANRNVMSVPWSVRDGSFVAGKPRVWAADIAGLAGFDVHPDGKRLAIAVPVTPREGLRQERTFVFIQNYFDELRRLAPPRP
jgi:serine/threonine-protein kinase